MLSSPLRHRLGQPEGETASLLQANSVGTNRIRCFAKPTRNRHIAGFSGGSSGEQACSLKRPLLALYGNGVQDQAERSGVACWRRCLSRLHTSGNTGAASHQDISIDYDRLIHYRRKDLAGTDSQAGERVLKPNGEKSPCGQGGGHGRCKGRRIVGVHILPGFLAGDCRMVLGEAGAGILRKGRLLLIGAHAAAALQTGGSGTSCGQCYAQHQNRHFDFLSPSPRPLTTLAPASLTRKWQIEYQSYNPLNQ